MRTSILLLLAACTPTTEVEVAPPAAPVEEPTPFEYRDRVLADRSHPTGSSTMATTTDGTAVFTVNTDAGSVARTYTEFYDNRNGDYAVLDAPFLVPVGSEPTRLARAGDALFVTLRGERSLARLSIEAFEDGVQQVVELGAEPFAVVADEVGQRVYVSLSMEDRVLELDGQTLEVLRTFDVPDEPRWMALHPSGRHLFVGSARGEARLTQIGLETGDTRRIALPETSRHVSEPESERVPLTPRLTGDLWITPTGTRLLVPAVYVDNLNAAPSTGSVTNPDQYYETSNSQTVGRFNTSLVKIELDDEGYVPEFGEPGRAFFVAPSVLFSPVRSQSGFLSSVSASPSGDFLLAAQTGTDMLLLLSPDSGGGPGGGLNGPGQGGFDDPYLSMAEAGSGPDGAIWALSDDHERPLAHSAFDSSVSAPSFFELREFMRRSSFGNELVARGPSVQVGPDVLPADVAAGRRLFYSSTASEMTSGGVSCSTCHFDGRNDGLSWILERGLRQTPSLAGRVSETVPVTWSEEVASVAEEATLTSTQRMGGVGLTEEQAANIAAFIDWTRIPDLPPPADPAAVERGRLLFERPDVGCADCHSGPRHTDNQSHSFGDTLPLSTPTLTGIAATAPYRFDGRLPTLRAVLEWSRDGDMGDTSMLTETELDDLEAYLRSL